MLNEFQNLSPAQQQEVIDFIQFLQYKAAQQWAGCVDSGLGDLSTNKAYLEGFGKA